MLNEGQHWIPLHKIIHISYSTSVIQQRANQIHWSMRERQRKAFTNDAPDYISLSFLIEGSEATQAIPAKNTRDDIIILGLLEKLFINLNFSCKLIVWFESSIKH